VACMSPAAPRSRVGRDDAGREVGAHLYPRTGGGDPPVRARAESLEYLEVELRSYFGFQCLGIYEAGG
jgi:hypothetical protein